MKINYPGEKVESVKKLMRTMKEREKKFNANFATTPARPRGLRCYKTPKSSVIEVVPQPVLVRWGLIPFKIMLVM